MGTVETLVGATYEGRYAIERVLSIGGMGTLFKATQLAVQRPVCVRVVNPDKVVDPEKVERFITEARKLASLTHANVIDLIDFGQDAQGRLFLVRDYLEGERLHRLIAREAPLDPGRIAHICAQILDPLAQAHQQGIVHRELNPRNIFVTQIGQTKDFIKLLEFRIADARDDTWVNQDRELPHYTPPELLTDGVPIDDRTDLYALGCILYELLTGHVPFAYRAYEDVTRAQIHEPMPPPFVGGVAVRGRLVDLIEACLQKDPERRPHDAAEALAILRDGEGPLITSAPAGPPPVPAPAYRPDPLAATVKDPVEVPDLDTRPERLGTGPLLRHQTTTIRHTGASAVRLDPDCALPGAHGAGLRPRRSVWPFVLVGALLAGGAFAALMLTGEDGQSPSPIADAKPPSTGAVGPPSVEGAPATPVEDVQAPPKSEAGSPAGDDIGKVEAGPKDTAVKAENSKQDAASSEPDVTAAGAEVAAGADVGPAADVVAKPVVKAGPVKVTIKSVPSRAVLYNIASGKPVTRTPATLEFKAGERHLLRLVKPGYTSVDLTLTDASKNMKVVMVKAPPKPKAEKTPEPKKRKPKKRKKRTGSSVKDFLP